MKSISSELPLFDATVASLAWRRARAIALLGRLLVLEAVTGGLPFRAFVTLPVRTLGGVAFAPCGPVPRINSAKSMVESTGTLASRAAGPDRDFMGIETGGFEPGPVCFPLVYPSVGGCEFKPVDFDNDNVLLNEEDRDRERWLAGCVVLTSSLIRDR